MPTISFSKTHIKPIQVEAGANLMFVLLSAGLPVASSCAGEAVCGKCKIQIVKGAEGLSQPNVDELFLADINNLPPDFRISCQTKIFADIEIDATYW